MNSPIVGTDPFEKAALIGVGLLGGSLGLALRESGLARRVAGFVRRPASVEECVRAGAVQEASLDIRQAVADADLVVLCTPIAQMRELMEKMLPALRPRALVTDVGSVKTSVVRALEPLARQASTEFVGSHPMAGAEKMGVGSARADLFANAVCVITPTDRSRPEAVRRIEALWQAVGARTLQLTPEAHDAFVSRSSHLPHVVAAQLASGVLDPAHPAPQAQLCANGFRDTTRIASGSPEMWRDIAMANAENLSSALGAFIDGLESFRGALGRRDGDFVEEFFASAKQRRDQWCARGASPSPE